MSIGRILAVLMHFEGDDVYGLRTTRGPLVFKLFETYSGIVAADPAAVPTCPLKGVGK